MQKTVTTNHKMDRKPTAKRQDNLQHILKVAEKIFSERGYRGATISGIAAEAGLPKANVLYYFKSKEALYKGVLNRLYITWNSQMSEMSADSHPSDALRNYIIKKVQQSKKNPNISRIFAAEILHGGVHLKEALKGELKSQFDETCQVFHCWIEKKWMDPVNPEHLIFMLWSTTQAYADHSLQMSILLEKSQLKPKDFEQGIELLTQVILKGCGVREQ